MKKLLDRRAVLRGVGGASIALPFLDAMATLGGMLPGTARAATLAATTPKRLVIMYTGNGFPMDRWKCPPAARAADLVLSPFLKPFESIKEHCTFIEGVPNNAPYDPASNSNSGHPPGTTSIFTGRWPGPGTMYGGRSPAGPPQGSSLDGLASAIQGKDTKFPAFYFQVIPTRTTNIQSRVFYGPQGQFISGNANPYDIYQSAFGDLPPPGGKPDQARQTRLDQQRSVLDAVMGQYKSLLAELPASDQARLTSHLDSIRDIERRLNIAPGASCNPSTQQAGVAWQKWSSAPAVSKLHMDAAALMLKCDLTRVIGIQWGFSSADGPDGTYTWLGPQHTLRHHDISHLRGPDPIPKLVEIGNFHAQQLVYLTNLLKDAPEGNGSVLDNTIILWATECGNGWQHAYKDIGFTLIGGGGGAVKGGRYLKFPGGQAYSHNRLLLTILQALGSNATTFGAPNYCMGGPLPGLT